MLCTTNTTQGSVGHRRRRRLASGYRWMLLGSGVGMVVLSIWSHTGHNGDGESPWKWLRSSSDDASTVLETPETQKISEIFDAIAKNNKKNRDPESPGVAGESAANTAPKKEHKDHHQESKHHDHEEHGKDHKDNEHKDNEHDSNAHEHKDTPKEEHPEPKKDLSSMIDFAVVGFEKCGTTFLLENIFYKSDHVYMAGGETGSEVTTLASDELDELEAQFAPGLNQTTESGARILTGFKNPMVLLNRRWLSNMHENFRRTQFVVTVRHPVLWFQSWYNYKLRTNKLDYPMPAPHDTIGLCREACRTKGPEGHCITVRSPGCSGHSNFHHYLARLGFTPMDTEEERALLDHNTMKTFDFLGETTTKVFLTEIGQFDGKNQTLSNGLVRDMEEYLGMEAHGLPDVHPYRQPNYTWTEERKKESIQICDDEYADIRETLVDVGRKASRWIEEYFLPSDRVVVSDKEDLLRRLRLWRADPCDEEPNSSP